MVEASRRSVMELLAKYTRAAPRYTSYPTVLDWEDGFRPDRYPDLLETAAKDDSTLSLYAHIPYCAERCLFCGCNVVITRKRERIANYVDRMVGELEALERAGVGRRAVHQLHWGGGTPTHLENHEIERLMHAIERTFRFTDDAERSIEVDPRATSPEQIYLLGQLGFRRISLGIQDLDPIVQKDIKRIQPHDMTREVIDAARSSGFESVNVDLIYGLPYQTEERFAPTVEKVLEFSPDRLALFHYAHVPWIKKHQQALSLEAMPDAAEKTRIFLRASETLQKAGFRAIGLDHFARPDDELVTARDAGMLQRNFMGYTANRGTDLLPLGCSSIGEVGDCYVQNAPDEKDYVERIEQDGLACVRGHQLSADDRLRRDVIHGLMCNEVVSKSAIEARHGIDFDTYFGEELAELEPLRKDGLVELEAAALRLTELGRLLMRNVALVFDRYLRGRSASDGDTTFSKTL